jgi:small subunit ribosomal protein S1
VEKFDPQTGKIGLSYRELFENPWSAVESKYPVKATVKGTVSRIMDFGAFVKLEPGVEGLVHVSELSHKRVFRVSDVLAEGQEVEALVLSVDAEAQRIGLSIKALQALAAPAESSSPPSDAAAEAGKERSGAPPRSRKPAAPLRGGLGSGPSEGAQFGLKW